MSEAALFCPLCGGEVRFREGASRKAGRMVYRCQSCERSLALLDEEESLVEAPDLDDSGLRTVSLQRAAPRRGKPEALLHAMVTPSESEGLPPGVALTLEFVDGPERGRSVAVSRSRCFLGREVGDISVEDPLVSRRHAVLEVYDGETIILKDLASTNGTYHNGHLIDHCKLSDGDEIRMGSSILTVLIDHPA